MLPAEGAKPASYFPSTILWANEDMTIVVLDVPGSIKDAQGPNMPYALVSREALEQRLQDYEPKSTKTRETLRNDRIDSAWHEEIAQGAETALKIASIHMQGRAWCRVRASIADKSRPSRKRSRDETNPSSTMADFSPSASSLSSLLASNSQRNADFGYRKEQLNESAVTSTIAMASHPTGHYGWNLGSQLDQLSIQDDRQDPQEFYIPESSAFLVCPCEEPILFHRFVRESSLALQRASDRFDVVLLDPPWPNLSAGRKGSYLLSNDYDTVQELLLDLPLSRYCAAEGYIAMWITNNARVRNMTHELGGLFEQWGVRLVEEWVWVKVTKSGEPILALDGLIKKPYEVLLVAQRHGKPAASSTENIKRRHLFAVPDLHSRKPCLKTLFEACLSGHGRKCHVLEIFARHLVQGWSSWGNEALQYNWKGHWT